MGITVMAVCVGDPLQSSREKHSRSKGTFVGSREGRPWGVTDIVNCPENPRSILFSRKPAATKRQDLITVFEFAKQKLYGNYLLKFSQETSGTVCFYRRLKHVPTAILRDFVRLNTWGLLLYQMGLRYAVDKHKTTAGNVSTVATTLLGY